MCVFAFIIYDFISDQRVRYRLWGSGPVYGLCAPSAHCGAVHFSRCRCIVQRAHCAGACSHAANMQAPKPRTLLTSEDTRRSTPQASLRAVLSTPLYALTSFNRIPRAAPLYAASAKSCLPTTCCATPFFHVRPVLLKHTLVPPKRLIVQLAL